jgi:hypothetical protein
MLTFTRQRVLALHLSMGFIERNKIVEGYIAANQGSG